MVENLGSGDWLDANRARWDELVPLHVASEFYDLTELRAGRGGLFSIEEEELAAAYPEGLEGKRILHLQCHFGADTLALAQRGAEVVGIDFSKPAVLQARELATELGLADRARFVHANVYDTRHILPQPGSFDIVYTTWGTIGWLPDVAEWARIVEWYLKPGGSLYFADGHPAAFVFDDGDGTVPVFRYAYDTEGVPDVLEEDGDYADAEAILTNKRTFEWSHPVSETVTALLDTGLRIDFLHEHYTLPWRMFAELEESPTGTFHWPDRRWLPLSWSISASKPVENGT